MPWPATLRMGHHKQGHSKNNSGKDHHNSKEKNLGMRYSPSPTGSTTNQSQSQGAVKPTNSKTIADFVFHEVLGEGSYATVHRAVDKLNGKEYAIKVIDKSLLLKEGKAKYAEIEKDVFCKLKNHPNFVKLYYAFQDRTKLYFVLSLATNGELLYYIKKLGSFNLECVQFYVAELVVALEYMHKKGVLHRDLKPENILLSPDMHLRLTDFGTAKIIKVAPPKVQKSACVSSSSSYNDLAKCLSSHSSEMLDMDMKMLNKELAAGKISRKSSSNSSDKTSYQQHNDCNSGNDEHAQNIKGGISSPDMAKVENGYSAHSSSHHHHHEKSSNGSKKGSLIGIGSFKRASILSNRSHKSNSGGSDSKKHSMVNSNKSSNISVSNILEEGNPIPMKRCSSFVGTAEYVSPEMLSNKETSPSSDLWALGCIIYQLIAGRPPFRGSNEYLTFQRVTKLEYTIPDGFPDNAKSLIEALLVLNPENRLGSFENGGIDRLKMHPFFDGIDWDNLSSTKPPPLTPYLPSKDKKLRGLSSTVCMMSDGLKSAKLNRCFDDLMKNESDSSIHSFAKVNHIDSSSNGAFSCIDDNSNLPILTSVSQCVGLVDDGDERDRLLKEQNQTNKWSAYIPDDELILCCAPVYKRRGFFSKYRQLILTDGPRIVYVSIEKMIKKGEIPWTDKLKVELKDSKHFFIHTPNRIYYIEDPAGQAMSWTNRLQQVKTRERERKSKQ